MISANSFGTNIENILGEILVKKTKLEELLIEIRNISGENITVANGIVEKLMSVVQVINERTVEVEANFAKLLSLVNNFTDMSDWENKIMPEIQEVYLSKLKAYLDKLLSVEYICERYFIDVMENHKATNNDSYELTQNVYKKDPENVDKMINHVYSDSVGYNWYSIKGSDDYLRNNNSVLNLKRYSKKKNTRITDTICKGSVVHDTISFHPSFGMIHYVSNARERVINNVVDEEFQSQFFTADFKTFDGFQGEINELKSQITRSIVSTNDMTNMYSSEDKSEPEYSMLLRHFVSDDDFTGNEYFILKVKENVNLEDGTPLNFFLNRNNLTYDIKQNYYDAENASTKTAMVLNTTDLNEDTDYSREEYVVEAKYDEENEDMQYNKKVPKIIKENHQLANIHLNINKDKVSALLINGSSNYMEYYQNGEYYNGDVSLAYYIRDTHGRDKHYDLFSNLVLQVMRQTLCHLGKQVSYLSNYNRMDDKGILYAHNNYQIVNTTNYGFYDTLTIHQLSKYGVINKSRDYVDYLGVIERIKGLRPNNRYDELTSFNLIEYYDIYANPLRKSSYYFTPYTSYFTTSGAFGSSNLENRIYPNIRGAYNMNYISNLYNNTSISSQNKVKGQARLMKHINENPNNYVSSMTDGILPENVQIGHFSNCLDDGHVIAIGKAMGQIYWSDDYGQTWNKAKIDYDNSPCKTNVDSQSDCHTMLRLTKNGVAIYPVRNLQKIYLRTTDYGKTWLLHNDGCDQADGLESIYCNDSGVCMIMPNGANSRYISVSTDYGASWVRRDTKLGWADGHACIVTKNGRLILTCNYSGATSRMYISDNLGETWTEIRSYGSDDMYSFSNTCTDYENNKIYSWAASTTRISYTENNFDTAIDLPNDGMMSDIWSDKYILSDGTFIYKNGNNLRINCNLMSNIDEESVLDVGNNKPTFSVCESERIIIYQKNDNTRIGRIKFRLNKDISKVRLNDDITPALSQRQLIGSVARFSEKDFEEIKEEVIRRVNKYNLAKDKTLIGTLIHLPYTLDESILDNKYIKCDGRLLKKNEYPELFAKIKDIYATDLGPNNEKSDVPEGYFRIPNYKGRILIGSVEDSKLGVNIENCLPETLQFNAKFGNSGNDDDRRQGPLSNNTDISSSYTSLLGGFKGGMDKSKITIHHNSTSNITSGNTYSVDIYIRAK